MGVRRHSSTSRSRGKGSPGLGRLLLFPNMNSLFSLCLATVRVPLDWQVQFEEIIVNRGLRTGPARSVFNLRGNSESVWGNLSPQTSVQKMVRVSEIDELCSVPGCLNVVTLNQCLETVVGKTTCFQLNSKSTWIPHLYREQQKVGREDHPPSLQSAVVFLSSAQACHGAIGVVQPLIGNTRSPIDCAWQDKAKCLENSTNQSLGIFRQRQSCISEHCQHPMSHDARRHRIHDT